MHDTFHKITPANNFNRPAQKKDRVLILDNAEIK